MADRKISEMTLLAQGDLVSTTDYLPIVDPSEALAANRNKRILGSSLVLGALSQATSVTIGGTLSETISSVVYPVASQFDVGTAPNQIPLNQYLGTMAWQDAAGVNLTGVMALLAGTAALPSLTFTGDPNTGIWSPAADTLAVSTNGVERLRVISVGFVGINDNNPQNWLDVTGTARVKSATVGLFTLLNTTGAGARLTLADQINSSSIATDSGALIFATASNTTERMRLDAAGNLGLGVTPSGNYSLQTLNNFTTGFRGFNLGGIRGGASGGGYPRIGYNIRLTNTADVYNYDAPDVASAMRFDSGIAFFLAVSGTAGTAISFTQAMTLDASGNLGVGVTNPSGANANGWARLLQLGGANPAFSLASTTNQWDIANFGGVFTIWNGTNERLRIDTSGNFIHAVTGTAPTLGTNSTMSFELTSNTSLKIVVRGTDGTTRSASLTLA